MNRVDVVFRVDGGRRIGLGHVRRCVTLANAIRKMGLRSLFTVRGDCRASEWVCKMGFDAVMLSPHDELAQTQRWITDTSAQAIVIDSYDFREEDCKALSRLDSITVVIDDLADRELPMDVVINGSAGAARLDYRVAAHTVLLLGQQYSLLREEFAGLPGRQIPEAVERVLITVGGSDPQNVAARLTMWAAEMLPGVSLDIVIGPLFEGDEEVRRTVSILGDRASLHYDPLHMRDLMLEADLALSGGGQTLYELAASGVPVIAVRLADNQTLNLSSLADAGVVVWAGDALEDGLEQAVKCAVQQLASDPPWRSAMSARGQTLVDGRGAERVAQEIVERVEGRPA